MEIQGASAPAAASVWQVSSEAATVQASVWAGSPLQTRAAASPHTIVQDSSAAISPLAGIAELRENDAAQGLGLWQGLQQFDERMHKLRYASQAAAHLDAPWQQLATAAQSYQLQQLREQLFTYVADQFAFGPSQVSMNAAQLAARRTETTATTAATAESAATAVTGGVTMSGVLGAVGAAYGGYQMLDSWGDSTPQAGAAQGAAMGAYVGSVIPGVGTAIGAVIGGVLGAAAGSISSGKHADQKARDAVRSFLQEGGMIDPQYQLRLADGSTYDIGVDGGYRLQNVDGSERAAYQVDLSNPLSAQVVGWLDPLAEVLTGGNEKLRSDFSGYFSNAALSNARNIEEARANVLAIYQSSGVSVEALVQGLEQLRHSGRLAPERVSAYLNGLRSLLAAN